MTDERNLSEFMSRRLYDDKAELSIWGKSLMDSYLRVSKLSFLPPLVWSRASQYMVFGSRVFGKLGSVGRLNSHVVLSARDPVRLPSIPNSFSYDLRAYAAVREAVAQKKSAAIRKLESRIQKILDVVRPQIFIANSTMDPINRVWIQVAKNAGANTYCLQHGVYAKEMPDYAQEEDIVDTYIALDASQKEIVSRNIDSKKIKILGNSAEFSWKSLGNSTSVCFVGEDWERYGFLDIKRSIIDRYQKVAYALRKNGLNSIWYKPHPSEVEMFGIDGEMRLLQQKHIELPDVFIGFSSSLLRDVSARGKLAIQILDERTQADNFQSNGYCLTVNNDLTLIDSILEIIGSDRLVPFVRDRALEDLLVMA
jgi:hypothetical protein